MGLMNNILQKITKNMWILRSLPQSIFFNFKFLPLCQAIHLPILLYKPKFESLKGIIKINGGIRFGMIRLGTNQVDLYPNSGITLNLRGTIVFNGRCSIGNNSVISTGGKSLVEFGHNFCATTTLKLVSYKHILFGDNVLVGWDCLFTDTDFHKLTNLDGSFNKGYGEIRIGYNNWIANGCRILKNVETPNDIVVGAYTVLTGKISVPEKSVIGNNHEIKILKENCYLNMQDMKINY